MAGVDAQPRRILRGTWAQILIHQDEIPRASDVEVRVFEPRQAVDTDPTIALLKSWIAEAPTDREAIQEAEEDLREFKRNMNRPCNETGARLQYPEAE